jgi:hypothetical protein
MTHGALSDINDPWEKAWEKGTFYFFASVCGRPLGRSMKLPFSIKAGWKDSKQ